MSVTVRDDTRPVSLLTPTTHKSCVSVFAKRYHSVAGSASAAAGPSSVLGKNACTNGSGADARETVGLALDRANSVAMLSREK